MIPADGTKSRLPARYARPWGLEFWTFVNRARPAARILDVGAGRTPTIAPADREPGVHYVGLDISASELEAAPPGSYDQIVVADAQAVAPELVDTFDLIVAWQVLEHFADLGAAADVFHRYMAPGGTFVACLSGRNAIFSVANRMLPEAVSSRLVSRLMRRPHETVFPAHYDRCDASGLRGAFARWDEVDVIPLWHGADYVERLGPLRALYLRYEDWAMEHGRENLATHYVVAARKRGAASMSPGSAG